VSDVIEIPAYDRAQRRGFFAQDFEVESYQQDVACARTDTEEVLNDLVDARRLAHLPRASHDFDHTLWSRQSGGELAHQGPAVGGRFWPDRGRIHPPRIEVTQDLL